MKLDGSKAGGALIGTDLGQLICSSLTYFGHIPINTSTEAAIIGITVFIVSHFLTANPTPPVSPATK